MLPIKIQKQVDGQFCLTWGSALLVSNIPTAQEAEELKADLCTRT